MMIRRSDGSRGGSLPTTVRLALLAGTTTPERLGLSAGQRSAFFGSVGVTLPDRDEGLCGFPGEDYSADAVEEGSVHVVGNSHEAGYAVFLDAEAAARAAGAVGPIAVDELRKYLPDLSGLDVSGSPE